MKRSFFTLLTVLAVVLSVMILPIANSETEEWVCPSCGKVNHSNFCVSCGSAMPVWICCCGTENNHKFCGNCGSSIDELIGGLNTALETLNLRDYESALEILKALGAFNSGSYETEYGSYVVAAEYIPVAYCGQAVDVYANGGSPEEINAFLQKAGQYPETAELIAELKYELANRMMSANDFRQALVFFQEISDVRDVEAEKSACCYGLGKAAFDLKDYETAVDYLKQAGDYSDAKDMLDQCYDMMGQNELKQGNYRKALDWFSKSSAIAETDDIIIETHYLYGKQLASERKYTDAVAQFEKCIQYKDAEDCLIDCVNRKTDDLMDQEQYEDAIEYYEKYSAKYKLKDIQNRIILRPGDGNVSYFGHVLMIAQTCGFTSSVSGNEESYLDKYVPVVKKIEAHFGLTEDGQLTLAEYRFLSQIAVPNEYVYYTGALEKLNDLGYLPNYDAESDYGFYNKKHISGVRKAENALGLTVDGCITMDEYNYICKLASPKITGDAALTARQEKGDVILNWKTVPNALWYIIYRNNESIGSTTKTYYRDQYAEMNKSHWYSVLPCSNYEEGMKASTSIFVDIVYKSLDFKAFFANKKSYLNGYYNFSAGKPVSVQWVGDDLYVKAKKENKYIYINIYDYDTWDWTDTDLLDDYYSNRLSNLIVHKCQYIGDDESTGIPVFKANSITRYH